MMYDKILVQISNVGKTVLVKLVFDSFGFKPGVDVVELKYVQSLFFEYNIHPSVLATLMFPILRLLAVFNVVQK